MAVLLYHTFAFISLFTYAIYHLVSSTRSLFKPSSSSSRSAAAAEYAARPYHPLPLPGLLRNLPLYLSLLSLLIAISHHAILSPSLHRLTSLQSAASLLLFLLIASSLLLLPSPLSLPSDLVFLLSSLAFALLSASSSHSADSYPPTDLQSKCHPLSSLISASSSALTLTLTLALFPRLFLADLALSFTLILQSLWSLQTGLSLYVELFIPDGCHRLLDVPESTTRCDLDDSRLRAAALLDLAFVLHATFTALVTTLIYVAVARASGGLVRRHNGGSYEALPTSSSSSSTLPDLDHVQMKAIAKSSTQA